MKRATHPLLLLMAALCMTTAGCESTGGTIARVKNKITTPEGGKAYVVATEKTSFYRYGPQQGNGPDAELPKDTLVNLIRNSFGYSKVQVSASGEQGFVASEDIMRASPTLLASLTKPALVVEPTSAGSAGSSSASEVENFDVRSTDSDFVPPPEDLPPPDLPPTDAESSQSEEPPPQ